MFDIGWSEMAIIMLLALIIIGPKDLPRVARTIGQWVRKARMLAREFQTSLEDMAKEAELDDVKKEIEKVGRTDLKKTVENAIDPKGDLKKAFDTSDGASGETTVGKTLNGSAATKPEAGESAKAATAESSPLEAKSAETKPKPAPKPSKAASASKPEPAKPARKPAAKKSPSTTKRTAAKKPAAPKKRAAKPASSTAKSGGDSASGDDPGGSAAMAAKPS